METGQFKDNVLDVYLNTKGTNIAQREGNFKNYKEKNRI